MLNIERVGKTYPERRAYALDAITLGVELGEIVAVIGGSAGCGKLDPRCARHLRLSTRRHKAPSAPRRASP